VPTRQDRKADWRGAVLNDIEPIVKERTEVDQHDPEKAEQVAKKIVSALRGEVS
jgi:hypothetical protein